MDAGIAVTRLDPDGGERFQRLRAELGVTTLGLNLITLQPGERGRIHRHTRQEEAFVVLEGTLDLVVEGETTEVEAMSAVRVAPSVRRQLVNRGPGRLVLLALGGSTPHDGRDGEAFASWEDTASAPPQEMALPADLPADELRS